MNLRLTWLVVMAFVLAGCAELVELAGEALPTSVVEPTAPPPVALQPVEITFEDTDSAVANTEAVEPIAPVSTSQETSAEISIIPLPTQTPAPLPTSPPAPTSAPTAASQLTSQRYIVDGLSLSTRDILSSIALVVSSAEIDATTNTLIFDVAFSNGSNDPINLTGSRIADGDWRLTDANGTTIAARRIDDQLSRMIPDGGFAPGGSTVGRVVFDIPSGPQPYTLAFASAFDYAPMSLWVDHVDQRGDAASAIGTGTFGVGDALYSSQEALKPLRLVVEEVVVSAETVTFNVNFINPTRRGYTVRGVDGSDAYLLGANGQQARPSAVSDSLLSTIAPPEGWQPYSDYRGTISFPRPADLSTARFIFNGFSPLTLTFDTNGLVSSAITSATGGAPPPPPAASLEDVTFDEIEALLASQAQALLAGNADLWAKGFSAEAQPIFADGLRRTAAVPLTEVTVTLSPSTSLREDQIASGVLSGIDAVMQFHLAEMRENLFRHNVRYDFVRTDAGWQIRNLAFTNEAPFWWDVDLVQSESTHFLLFATSDAALELSSFAQEVETAWTAVNEQGIPLDDRYIAYYTATQQEFAEQAGGSQLQLGVARSRYQIVDGDLTISNRIFYINGQAFADESIAAINQRQVTVTHELLHLALGNLTRPFTPPWLTEGSAVYFSGDVSAEQRERLLASAIYNDIDLTALTRARSLGAHDFVGNRASAEYAYSGELVNYLVDTYGKIAVLNFYRSFDTVSGDLLIERIPSGATAVTLDAVMSDLAADVTPQLIETAFNTTLPELERAFRTWLESESEDA